MCSVVFLINGSRLESETVALINRTNIALITFNASTCVFRISRDSIDGVPNVTIHITCHYPKECMVSYGCMFDRGSWWRSVHVSVRSAFSDRIKILDAEATQTFHVKLPQD